MLLTATAVAAFAASGVVGRGDAYLGDGVDVYGTFWFYWWIERCFSLGESPGFTDLMFHPSGKDIFAHTGGNFVDAALSIPFQWALGSPGFQPWFYGAIVVGNAWSMMPLARHVLRTPVAVWVASSLWAMNPFVLTELASGRPTQALLWFVPLALYHFLRTERGARDGILAGLYTGASAWVYWFNGWFLALALACLAAAKWKSHPHDRRRLCASWGAALVAVAAVVFPAVWAMSQRVTAGPVVGLSGAGLAGAWSTLTGPVSPEMHGWMVSERMGQPLFRHWTWAVLAFASLKLGWRWVAVLGTALAFSIGPVFSVDGTNGVHMPHYVLASAWLPFLERLWFPYRWTMVGFLVASLAGGELIRRCSRRQAGWGAALLGLVAVDLVRLGTAPLVVKPYVVPAVFSEMGNRGGGLIELPMSVVRESLMWQPVHQQPLFGGMAENSPVFWTAEFKHAMGNRFIRHLRQTIHGVERPAPFVDADREQIEATGMRWVVLDKHALMRAAVRTPRWQKGTEFRQAIPDEATDGLVAVLGPPVAVEGRFAVWDLKGQSPFPGSMAPTPQAVHSTDWVGSSWSEYEARVVDENTQ